MIMIKIFRIFCLFLMTFTKKCILLCIIITISVTFMRALKRSEIQTELYTTVVKTKGDNTPLSARST